MPDGAAASPERPKTEAVQADPLRDLLARLNRDAATVAAKDPDLSRTIGQLASVINQPGKGDNPTLHTKAAYALQDFEKLAGPISTMPTGLREEMTRLAATAPGLQNDRLQELVRQTPGMSDRRLVADIRDLALNTGFQGGDQSRPEVRDKIESLENRVRLASGAAAVISNGPPSSPGAAAGPTARVDGRTTPSANASPPPFVSSQADAALSGAARPNQSGPTPSPQRSPGNHDTVGKEVPNWENGQAAKAALQQQPSTDTVQSTARGPGALSLALGALAHRWYASTTDGSSERPPSPIAERSARHEQQFQGQRDSATVTTAEKSQAAALNAVRDFTTGPASNILTKIQDAAKSDPGGMAAVLAEMRDGGRFAGLRTQLNADLATERGAAAAYDRMAGALTQYGTDRAAVDAVGIRNNTAAALTARFQSIDAEIGKAVSMLPSKADGKSMMDDLGDRLKQVLDRAVEAVKSVFSPAAERSARASASPSPSP